MLPKVRILHSENIMDKRVLYLAASKGLSLDQSGGAGTHMRGTIKAFNQHGLKVLPIIGGDILKVSDLTTKTKFGNQEWTKKGIRNILKAGLPTKLRLFLRDLRTISEDKKLEKLSFATIKKFKPDFIYERSSYLSTYGVRLAKKLQIPYYLESDGCMVEIISTDYGVFSKKIGNWIERWKLKKATYTVCMSIKSMEQIATKFRLDKNNMLVKPLGIDPPKSLKDKASNSALIEKFGIANKLVIGFVGAISIYHGVKYLIETATLFQKEKCDEICFIIVGWSDEGAALKRIAEDRGLKNVIFTGKIDKSEIERYFYLFDLGIIPDSEENFYPIKTLEYGIYGVCPIAPAYPAFFEIINPDKNGYLFKPKSPNDIFRVLKSAMTNPDEIRNKAAKWSAFVAEHFIWKDTINQIVQSLKN